MSHADIPSLLAGDWAADAACAGVDSDVFFPPGKGSDVLKSIAEAKAYCAVCPVAAECLEYAVAMQQNFGIWGGATPRERQRIRTRRRRNLRAVR